MTKVESFTLDHNKVKAPYVRLAGTEEHEKGGKLEKYDLRLLQPNEEAIPTSALHTLEHFFAIHLREELDGVIDVSPMGCRTGFYLIIWNDHEPKEIAQAVVNVLNIVLKADKIEATTAKECGNYRDHSLYSAKEYAQSILNNGISIDPFEREIVLH